MDGEPYVQGATIVTAGGGKPLKPRAEGVGFEPTRACTLPVFKTGAFNRSATPPWGGP